MVCEGREDGESEEEQSITSSPRRTSLTVVLLVSNKISTLPSFSRIRMMMAGVQGTSAVRAMTKSPTSKPYIGGAAGGSMGGRDVESEV